MAVSPSVAWAHMVAGNKRFVEGRPQHPRQNVEHRSEIAASQNPEVALFGCADSRLSAEIIFDKGLGDLFVVRNAGQVISDSVIGSLEYAIEALNIPLIVVLSHDSCGAVKVALEQEDPEAPPLPPNIKKITDSLKPAIERIRLREGSETSAHLDASQVGQEHLRDTVSVLVSSSELISLAIAEGRLGLVGANYTLAEGVVTPDVIIGAVNYDH